MTDGLHLRLTSARVPYGRAGVQFGHHPDRAFGLATVAVEDLREGAVAELLADPFIDVLVGVPGGSWVEVVSVEAFVNLSAAIHPVVRAAIAETMMLVASGELVRGLSDEVRQRIETSFAAPPVAGDGLRAVIEAAFPDRQEFADELCLRIAEAAANDTPEARAAIVERLNVLCDNVGVLAAEASERARLKAEQGRDGGPMGDEDDKDTTRESGASAPPSPPAAGGEDGGSQLGTATAPAATGERQPSGDPMPPAVVAEITPPAGDSAGGDDKNSSTAAGEGGERPSPEGAADDAQSVPGDAAAPPAATASGEESAEQGGDGGAVAEGTQPSGDLPPPAVVASPAEPAARTPKRQSRGKAAS